MRLVSCTTTRRGSVAGSEVVPGRVVSRHVIDYAWLVGGAIARVNSSRRQRQTTRHELRCSANQTDFGRSVTPSRSRLARDAWRPVLSFSSSHGNDARMNLDA
jgi:hypothetical protein